MNLKLNKKKCYSYPDRATYCHWPVGSRPRQQPRGDDVAREAHCQRIAGDGAAVPGLERTGFLHHQNEHNAVSIMVPAPPRIGHRSKLDGEAERQRSQITGAGMI
jgi:hypothetical protein